MPREFERKARVAAEIQRTLAEVVRDDARDPRLANITVCGVEVTRDLAYARVYVAVLGGNLERADPDNDDTLAALKRAAPFLRTALAHRLKIRTVPELHFIYDDTLDRGARISALLEEESDDGERTE